MSEFGDNVRQLLDSKGLTQQDLADRMGVSKQSIYSFLKTKSPGTTTLKRVAAALDVEISDLLPKVNKVQDSIVGYYTPSKLIRLPYLSIPVLASFIEMGDFEAEFEEHIASDKR